MRHAMTLAVLTLGLLAVGIACGDGDDAPAATGTPATAADEATATVAIDPTEPPPQATATPPGPTATPRPDLEGPCPVDDETFCQFAAAIDRALQSGDINTIVANTEQRSQTCSGLEQIGPCFGLAEATRISGYLVGFDASDNIAYESEEGYLTFLRDIASAADVSASDEYGNGSWRLAAIVNEGPDMIVLVTTIIGIDPIYELTDSERRVFLFRAQRTGDIWQISILLTTVFRDLYLNGLNADGSAFEDWLPWGEE